LILPQNRHMHFPRGRRPTAADAGKACRQVASTGVGRASSLDLVGLIPYLQPQLKQGPSGNSYYIAPIEILNMANMNELIRGAVRCVPLIIAAASMLLGFTTARSQPADHLRAAPLCRARTLDLRAAHIKFTTPTHTPSADTWFDVFCGSERALPPPPKGAEAQSYDTESCDQSYKTGLADFRGNYVRSYDTLKAFIQRCPTHPKAPHSFGLMIGDVAHGGNGPLPEALFIFRAWLISAFAWNPHDPTYFCADVETIMQTFGTKDTSWWVQNDVQNRGLSVLYWLIHNPLCTNYSDSQGYTNGRGSQRETWFNTQDTNEVPLDTTIYSMHDLGLDSVLKYAAMLGVHSNNMPDIISSAIASPNPMKNGTLITFSTSREAFVKIEVFDLLGNKVATNGFEGIVEHGTHSIPISLGTLSRGSYYARITTTYGEAQTVKLIKE
jgi:hypothetical protein